MVFQTSVSRTYEGLHLLIPLVVNETYACENNQTLNGLLKTELGFEGCMHRSVSVLTICADSSCSRNVRLGSYSFNRIRSVWSRCTAASSPYGSGLPPTFR